MRSYPDFTPMEETGVRRTREQWVQYYEDLARHRVTTEQEAREMRNRWARNSAEYFARKDALS